MKIVMYMLLFSVVLLPSCASVGAVIEGGKEFTTGVVDGAVKGTRTVVTAVADDVVSVGTLATDTVVGVVDTVADEVDRQTNELQEEQPEKK
jgi:hypothetical protein